MPKTSEPSTAVMERPSFIEVVIASLLTAAVFLYAHFPAFTNPYIINDDVRQQIFWMQAWQDPGLYPGDLLADYARRYVPWGVAGLYWLASALVSPLTFSKVLPGLLFVFLGTSLFLIGARLGGRRLAWTTAGVFWLMPFFLHDLAGGLARAFAAPLLGFFLLSWLSAWGWGMALAVLAMSLCIPYMFPVAAAAVLLAWGLSRLRAQAPPAFPVTPGHWASLFLGAAFVVMFNHQFAASGYGPLVTAAQMAGHPEFTDAGRFAIFPIPSVFWEFIAPWERLAPFRELGLIPGIIGAVALLTLAAWGALGLDWPRLRPSLPPLGYVAAASLLFYILARLFLLRLFIPDRYLMYTLNLFYCLILAACIQSLLARLPRSGGKWLIALVLLAAVLGGLRLRNQGLYDFSVYQDAYAAVARTPKDALIAGHPNLMDNILTFGRRRAFVTFELAHPWAQGYWARIEPRLTDFFTAYYSSDPEVVREFCRRYHIAYLLVDDRHFTSFYLAGGRFAVPFDPPLRRTGVGLLTEKVDCPFFAPFGVRITRSVADRRNFAVLSGSFPAMVINPHLRLLDMRTPAPPTLPAAPP